MKHRKRKVVLAACAIATAIALGLLFPRQSPQTPVSIVGLPHVLHVGQSYPYQLRGAHGVIVRVTSDSLDAGSRTVNADYPGVVSLRVIELDGDRVVARATWTGEAR